LSGHYVQKVKESGLDEELMRTAEGYATFADRHGSRIWPSKKYLAWLIRRDPRTVQRHTRELLRIGVLELVRAATQHFPPQYRLRLDRLPPRQPFLREQPEIQPELLRDEDGASVPEEIARGDTDVSPGTRGDKSELRGDTQGSPDPSLDPSRCVSADARAREPDEQTPLTGLVGEVPRRGRHHHAHAWCGRRKCVPKWLHCELLDALDTRPQETRAEKLARLQAFYAATLAAIPDTEPIEPDPAKFWRVAFAAACPARTAADETRRQAARLDRREVEEAKQLRHIYGGCMHDPKCESWQACVRVIALARRVS
jgi:hypothetical protein